jgi:hypothetical protein
MAERLTTILKIFKKPLTFKQHYGILLRMSYSGYLEPVVKKQFRPLILKAMKWICRHEIGTKKFGSIAFRGMSGAMIAPSVADALGKSLIAVRKQGESSHASVNVEAESGIEPGYIIVDDFISTGATIDAIIDTIANKDGGYFKPVAIVLYRTHYSSTATHRGIPIIPFHIATGASTPFVHFTGPKEDILQFKFDKWLNRGKLKKNENATPNLNISI